MIVQILIGIIIIHLIAGFAFMLWKLNGPVNDGEDNEADSDSTVNH